MPRQNATSVALFALTLLLLTAASPAGAVIQGTFSSLGAYTVRLVGPHYCSGVAIGSRLVVTAAHCGRRSMRVMAGGGSAGIAGVSRSAVLDDGRRVHVSGDAVILRLSAPLSGAYAAPIGDSGGPVMRGGKLVGVITRANYPRKRIACGFYTRWAPVTASGQANEIAVAAIDDGARVAEPRRAKRQRHGKRAKEIETQSFNLFASWFTPKAEQRRSLRRKQASVRLSRQEPAFHPVRLPE